MINLLTASFPGLEDPGACLLVARDGEVIEQECRGLANLTTREPITADTTFRLASITKQFTATVILLLRQREQLRTDQHAADFLPELKYPVTRLITIQHLLQHTSGLLDYEDHIPAGTEKPVSDAEVLKITAQHHKSYFRPGTQFRYSNTGYALLACIAERLLGKPYPVILEELIFHPLGMSNTVARHDTVRPNVPNRSMGYRRMPDGSYAEADQNLTSHVIGDGGIYCSGNDYLKWDRAYWSGAILPLEVVHEMTTPGHLLKKGTATLTDRIWFPPDMNERPAHVGQGESPGPTDDCWYAGGELQELRCEIPYGLGWRLETNDDDLRIAYHPGSSTGFMHCVRHVIEKGLTVLVLANRTVAPSKELARQVEAELLSQG